jgi:hypothetical protein
MNKTYSAFLIFFLTGVLFSCTKEAGDGGNSTIYGKIIAHNYNAEFTNLKGIYPAADEDVFIIYGDDRSFSQRVRTNYNGIYEFKYLRKGDYTIYAYSKDSTLTLPSEMYAVIRNVKIEDNKQTVEVEDMKIFR